jgi:hypothetical protein
MKRPEKLLIKSNKMAKIKIKLGDAQPLPCGSCNGIYGYQISDLLRVSFVMVMNPSGLYEEGFYSDRIKAVHEGTTAFCCNCGERLDFKVERKKG